jgi:hypothetical protein
MSLQTGITGPSQPMLRWGEGFDLGFEDQSNLLGWFNHPGIQSETIEHGFPNNQILEPSYGVDQASHQSLSGLYPDCILNSKAHENPNQGIQQQDGYI